MATYALEGLNGLAAIIIRRNPYSRELAKDVTMGFIYRALENPDHAMWSLVQGYVKDY
jgi:hypothetical protein